MKVESKDSKIEEDPEEDLDWMDEYLKEALSDDLPKGFVSIMCLFFASLACRSSCGDVQMH